MGICSAKKLSHVISQQPSDDVSHRDSQTRLGTQSKHLVGLTAAQKHFVNNNHHHHNRMLV